jgi:hypothetical protein
MPVLLLLLIFLLGCSGSERMQRYAQRCLIRPSGGTVLLPEAAGFEPDFRDTVKTRTSRYSQNHNRW